MAQLAIKGHSTRGKEVIEILEMLGGTNKYNCLGVFEIRLYLINASGDIEDISLRNNSNYQIYTLEEFLEKFPYKVGDKVIDIKTDRIAKIYKAHWSESRNCTYYDLKLSNNTGFVRSYKFLQPYKEETMGEIKIDIPKGYEFVGISNDKQQVVFTKIRAEYPKTYEECCDILQLEHTFELKDLTMDEEKLMDNFIRLKRCRDAYWKLEGEQMGLGKPWEPDYNNEKQLKYGLYEIIKYSLMNPSQFAFPTAEMRDAFYENFKDLIEQCKELL